MKVIPLKTHRIEPEKNNLFRILDEYITHMSEKNILTITSKIISICEGSVVKKNGRPLKDKLTKAEADYYLPLISKNHTYYLTIKYNRLTPVAGIDESNAGDHYILWPKDPQRSANRIRSYLKKRFKCKKLGVVITDSKSSPLRTGVIGIALAHSGFKALNDYVGHKDLFGRKLQWTKTNVAESIAVAAVFTMGEGDESTPLALVTSLKNVTFTTGNPTQKELNDLIVPMRDDIYGPMLKQVNWRKGKGGAKRT